MVEYFESGCCTCDRTPGPVVTEPARGQTMPKKIEDNDGTFCVVGYSEGIDMASGAKQRSSNKIV